MDDMVMEAGEATGEVDQEGIGVVVKIMDMISSIKEVDIITSEAEAVVTDNRHLIIIEMGIKMMNMEMKMEDKVGTDMVMKTTLKTLATKMIGINLLSITEPKILKITGKKQWLDRQTKIQKSNSI